jgi:signal peptidase I
MRRLAVGAGAASLLVAGYRLTARYRRRFLVVTVTGTSMLPALMPGDRLLVRRAHLGQVHAGQVAVIERPGLAGDQATAAGRADRYGDLIIKRVAAVPGQHIPTACRRAAAVSLGAAEVGSGAAENAVGQVRPGSAVAPSPARVPERMFIILGDNPDRSFDSRQAGLVAGDRLIGVAVRRISPARAAVRGETGYGSPAWSATAS